MSDRFLLKFVLLSVLVITAPALLFAQDVAIITGKVTDSAGEPLAGANVFIELTNLGAATDEAGKFSFSVPARFVQGQEVKITARFIGFRSHTEKVVLKPGTIQVNFELAEDVLDMEAIVVTGVLGEMPKEKLAFTVSRVETEAIQMVPAVNAMSSLKGKVAGVKVIQGQGQPGTGVSVRLRGATSINTSGRTGEPLFVVDGVILAANQVDIDALDIESIELVKGAAAASLYGSRAANGVVQIRTRRGNTLGLNQTRFTIRNEIGFNSLPLKEVQSKSHQYKINENGEFIDDDGNVVDFGDAVLDDDAGYAFQDNPFPPPLYDHMDLFFDPGTTIRNYIALSHNSRSTNYRLSFGNLREPGVVTGMEGYTRRNVRLNFDHNIRPGIDLSFTGYFSSSKRDQAQSAINPFFGLMFLNPTANLLAPNDDGTPYKIQPDPRTLEENPLYAINTAEIERRRQRIQSSVTLRYAPLNWLDIEGNFSFDRSDRNDSDYYPKGYKTIDATTLNQGRYQKANAFDEAMNANVTATVTRTFGGLTTRSQLRYLVEDWKSNSTFVRGDKLTVGDVRDLGVVEGEKVINSSLQRIRSSAYYWITAIDYRDKYIGDFQVQRYGSSLFGPDARWNTYYRVSGAWRLSLEPWWFTDKINEFKLRFSYGTGGGRPSFAAQYETYSVSSGVVSPANLGNKNLKPEFAIERELGVNMAFLDRFGLEFVYAKSTVKDQILLVPLAGYFGFSNRWENAGTLESSTIEANLQASLKRSRDVSWSLNFVFDRTRQKITEFGPPAYRFGPQNAFYNREGEVFGSMYGRLWMTNKGQLDDYMGGVHANSKDQFDVNDDGLLVPVGSGNTFKDGVSKNLWGTKIEIDGVTYNWGHPIGFVDAEGNSFVKIGEVLPDFNLGFSSTFKWKGFTAYFLLDAEIGGTIYNNTRQWAYRELRHKDVDQFGKPEELKKPITYYAQLYDVNAVNSWFAEDGTYMKLRELNLSYTFNRSQLANLFGGVFGGVLNRLTLGVIGRNLLTFTNYTGFDPEVGQGDATLFRYDGFRYPNYRTITAVFEIEF
jgi:TonB-linked SusC/RagA family outer membrane protein